MNDTSQKGQALVEFALILVLTIASIAGVIWLTGPVLATVYCNTLDEFGANSSACSEAVAERIEHGGIGTGGSGGGGGGSGSGGGGGGGGGGGEGGGSSPTATSEPPTATLEAPTATVEAPTETAAPPTETPLPPTATATHTLTPTATQTATATPEPSLPISDDFSDGYGNWTVASGSSWSVASGQLCMGPGANHLAFAGDSTWSDYTVQIGSATLMGGSQYHVLFRAQNTSTSFSGYSFHYSSSGGGQFRLTRWTSGSETALATASPPSGFSFSASHQIEIRAIGNTLTVLIDGVQYLQASDDTYSDGGIGVRTSSGGGSNRACFDDISAEAA